MRFFAIASSLAALASAARVDVTKRDAAINVQLEMAGNTAVKASLTNQGEAPLKVLKTGSLLDTTAVEKVQVFSGDKKLDFEGIKMNVATQGLEDDAFQVIDAGETVTVEFDMAETYDLSSGGTFSIVATGLLEYAEMEGNSLVGELSYSSNTITAEVDGAEAASVQKVFQDNAKRSILTNCSGSRGTAMRNAMSRCRSLALGAQSVAQSGSSSKMVEFYKSSSSSVRRTVANTFARVAQECGSTTSGVARYYCTDVYNVCRSGVIAYAIPSQSIMANCDLFYRLPGFTSQCYGNNQASTVLHEVTHLRQIKGTEDYGAYGYNAVRRLTAAQNLNHADTYTLFAQSIANRC